MNAVSTISSDMQHFPPTELLCHRYIFAEFDPKPIVDILSLLTPQRACSVFVSKVIQTTP